MAMHDGRVPTEMVSMTIRDVPANGERPWRQPWRVVLTRNGNLPPTAHLFTDEWKERTLVYREQPLLETLRELLQGISEGAGIATPPLAPPFKVHASTRASGAWTQT